MLPEIAVLMPVYNPKDEEIRRTLESIRVQDEPYHLYIIDDGSARKPKYQDLLVDLPHTLIELPANRGITGALNAGLDVILRQSFKYIARIDCGDVALKERFGKQRRYLDQRPDVAVLGTDTRNIHPHLDVEYYDRRPEDHASLVRKMQYNTPLSHPTVMIRPDLFRAVGVYSNEYDAAEDYELWRRADRAGYRFANLTEVLLIKIEDSNSISQRKRVRQLISRLRLQWKYFSPLNIHSMIGLVRTLIQLSLPPQIINALKSVLKKSGPKVTMA
jgi:glycosyltransferase involved in cell wall biosynthesis